MDRQQTITSSALNKSKKIVRQRKGFAQRKIPKKNDCVLIDEMPILHSVGFCVAHGHHTRVNCAMGDGVMELWCSQRTLTHHTILFGARIHTRKHHSHTGCRITTTSHTVDKRIYTSTRRHIKWMIIRHRRSRAYAASNRKSHAKIQCTQQLWAIRRRTTRSRCPQIQYHTHKTFNFQFGSDHSIGSQRTHKFRRFPSPHSLPQFSSQFFSSSFVSRLW